MLFLFCDRRRNRIKGFYKRGTAVDASQKVYDTILKGYGQEDGIRSYGTVVDLLVAYYRDTARTNGSEGLTT